MRTNYVIIFFVITLIGFSYIYYQFSNGELANKEFYVALQGFAEQPEYNPPSTSNKNIAPLFIKAVLPFKGKLYDMLGIPTKNEKFPYFWVVTNNHDNSSPPEYIFSITAGDQFYLSCDYLHDLESKEKIDTVVSKFLRGHCVDK